MEKNIKYMPVFHAKKKIGYLYLLAKDIREITNKRILVHESDNETIIYVLSDSYYEILEKGSLIAYNKHYKVNWVDINKNIQNINYYPIFKCYLNNNYNYNFNNNDYYNWPKDIKEYINDLRNTIYGKNISFNYEKNTNSFNVYINCQLSEYKELSNIIKKYNKSTKPTIFKNINYINFDGQIIDKNNQDNNLTIPSIRFNNLKSYFNKSSYMTSLINPQNEKLLYGNIPKTTNRTKFYLSSSNIGIDYLNTIIDKKNSTLDMLKITGNFSVFENKTYKYNNFNYNSIIESKSSTKDTGVFESTISASEDRIDITTKSTLTRKVTGSNKDNKNIRNKIFIGFPNKNYVGESTIKETFQLIENNTRLLHYTSHSNCFEIYEVPTNFKITDGIEYLSNPKVFNEKTYDHYDKSLKEVNRILKKKTNPTLNLKRARYK